MDILLRLVGGPCGAVQLRHFFVYAGHRFDACVLLGPLGGDAPLGLLHHVQQFLDILLRLVGGPCGAAEFLEPFTHPVELGSVALYVFQEFLHRLFFVGDVPLRLVRFGANAHKVLHPVRHPGPARLSLCKPVHKIVSRPAQPGKIPPQRVRISPDGLSLRPVRLQLGKPTAKLVLLALYLRPQRVSVVGGGLVVLHPKGPADYILPPAGIQYRFYLLLGGVHRVPVNPALGAGVGRLPKFQHLQYTRLQIRCGQRLPGVAGQKVRALGILCHLAVPSRQCPAHLVLHPVHLESQNHLPPALPLGQQAVGPYRPQPKQCKLYGH